MTSGRERFVHKLTKTSSVILEQQIEESLDESGISAQLEKLERQEKQLQLAESEKAALRTGRALEDMNLKDKNCLPFHIRKNFAQALVLSKL